MNNIQTQVQVPPRRCGLPIKGGTYASVPSGFYGMPIWDFLVDPTVPVDADMNLSAIETRLEPRMIVTSKGRFEIARNKEGKIIYDVFDTIGEGKYPNPSDWFMEVAVLGFHQKIKPSIVTQLVEESDYYAVHRRAGYLNPTAAYESRMKHPEYPVCPKNYDVHMKLHKGDKQDLGTCPGLFFSDLLGGTLKEKGKRDVTVHLPAPFDYVGFCPTGGEGEYISSVFFKLPIGLMATFLVYEDDECGAHEAALKELEKLDQKLQRVKLVQL